MTVNSLHGGSIYMMICHLPLTFSVRKKVNAEQEARLERSYEGSKL